MRDSSYWNLFEQTGSIDAYLLYACASETGDEKAVAKEDNLDESGNKSGNTYGYGAFRDQYRGL